MTSDISSYRETTVSLTSMAIIALRILRSLTRNPTISHHLCLVFLYCVCYPFITVKPIFCQTVFFFLLVLFFSFFSLNSSIICVIFLSRNVRIMISYSYSQHCSVHGSLDISEYRNICQQIYDQLLDPVPDHRVQHHDVNSSIELSQHYISRNQRAGTAHSIHVIKMISGRVLDVYSLINLSLQTSNQVRFENHDISHCDS